MNEPAGIRSRTGATVGRSAGTQSRAFLFLGFKVLTCLSLGAFRPSTAHVWSPVGRAVDGPQNVRAENTVRQKSAKSTNTDLAWGYDAIPKFVRGLARKSEEMMGWCVAEWGIVG
jgi:hypothetical protein